MIFTTRCAGCDCRGPVLCRTCRFALVARPGPGAPHGIVVATAYSGRVRDVMLGLKYRNRRLVAAHLAGILARRLAGGAGDLDVVTWAPTSGPRRRRRGFDQAELIARAVAAQLGLPCRRLLERDGRAPAQTGRSRRQRLAGPCFRVHPRAAGRRILVVDDIVTTGATLESAGQWLRRGGAADVVLAAVAATPDCLLPQQRVA
jgi:predicted amidophosphoribosyltransferase